MKDFSSIVVSSKIRLVRNLSGFVFPSMLKNGEDIKVLNKIADTVLGIDKSFKIYSIKKLSELDANVMNEKGLITNALIESNNNTAVILSEDEDVSIMINETDHIVETCTKKGLNLISAYDELNVIDNNILSKLDVAYDESLGFLTSDLNQVGTGLNVRISLFLPALTITGRLKNVIDEIYKQGIEVKAFNDNASQENKYICVLSNLQTIGKRESEYVVKITDIAIKVSELEIKARTELLSMGYVDEIKDKVFRAWGILTNCFKISASEAQNLINDLKMGVALDLIRFKDVSFIDKLLIDVMPYSLTKISGSTVSAADIDKYRAQFLANVLKSKRVK